MLVDNREYISMMDYAELQPLQAMQVRPHMLLLGFRGFVYLLGYGVNLGQLFIW